jgi:hypothetical protein
MTCARSAAESQEGSARYARIRTGSDKLIRLQIDETLPTPSCKRAHCRGIEHKGNINRNGLARPASNRLRHSRRNGSLCFRGGPDHRSQREIRPADVRGQMAVFRNFNWACLCTQIPWKEEGHEGVKLGYLLNDYGRFHNGHRAIDDCRALLYLLAQPLAQSKSRAMGMLLDNARKAQYQAVGRERALRLQGRFNEPGLPLERGSPLLVGYSG